MVADMSVSSDGRKKGSSTNNGMNGSGKSSSMCFKYIMHERNKLYYIYLMLREIVDLELQPETQIHAFLMMKYLCNMAEFLKVNLVDTFNINMFPCLRTKFDNWNQFIDSLEYKSIC